MQANADTAADGWLWSGLVGDSRAWVLDSGEPSARWALLTGVYDLPASEERVLAARREVLNDPATSTLMGRLPDWEGGLPFAGHNSPAFAPNLLNLLADMGLQQGDASRVDATLELMIAHQDEAGRFQSFAPVRGGDEPVWGALLCDSHAILEVLVRFGFVDDPRVRAGLARMGADLAGTSQGVAWPCRQDPATGFRGPGRKGDFCPQVTLEALRVLALVPESDRPEGLLDVARVALSAWRARGEQKPYMFGHGRAFKTGKWPPTWYSALAVLDALGRYPALWRGKDADQKDRLALAELVACLVEYSMTAEGKVVPQSIFRGFTDYSFGQKVRPSAFATARVLTVLHRFDDLAGEAAAVDIAGLASSKGGTGYPVAPRVGRPSDLDRANPAQVVTSGGRFVLRKPTG